MTAALFGGDNETPDSKPAGTPDQANRGDDPASSASAPDESPSLGKLDPDITDYSPDIAGAHHDEDAPDPDGQDPEETSETETAQNGEQDEDENGSESSDEDENEESAEWDEATQAAFDLVKQREKEKRAKIATELEEARKQLDALKPDAEEARLLREKLAGEIKPAPLPEEPLADVFTPEELDARRRQAHEEKQSADTLLRHLRRGQVEEVHARVAKAAPGIAADADDLEDWLYAHRDRQEDILTNQIGRRQAYLAQMEKANRFVDAIVPEVKDAAFHREMTGHIASAPWVKLAPHHRHLAAAMTLGMREINRRVQEHKAGPKSSPQSTARPKPAAKASKAARPKSGPQPSAAPAAPRGRRKSERESSDARFIASGSEADLAKAITARLK